VLHEVAEPPRLPEPRSLVEVREIQAVTAGKQRILRNRDDVRAP
jgi:hypothetical protein